MYDNYNDDVAENFQTVDIHNKDRFSVGLQGGSNDDDDDDDDDGDADDADGEDMMMA